MTGLASIARRIDGFSDFVGKYVSWLALVMVLVQFAVVLARYVFGIGSIAVQETIIYSHALLFMLGSAYTLLHGGHVRVDIFYADTTPKTKAIIDALGTLFFLIPVCLVILLLSWSYVAKSWEILEISRETSGIPFVYGLKTVIVIFCGMMILQGISTILHSILILTGHEKPHEEEKLEVI
ncbi:TRAP transporter small permease subunit [Sneathiella chinensis]|uniref:TRAP transporter small permease protein n=1 Tax=Sneathiella chinensis TaxID=349750 RepID=A0ABQ5U2Y6_9PROT|nr:TRAP transporter small permease subunit [Sneathiella chinensis]GLQ06442.1 hypothetical protein GCM10007924_16630 [Sneathiella chinensis]